MALIIGIIGIDVIGLIRDMRITTNNILLFNKAKKIIKPIATYMRSINISRSSCVICIGIFAYDCAFFGVYASTRLICTVLCMDALSDIYIVKYGHRRSAKIISICMSLVICSDIYISAHIIVV